MSTGFNGLPTSECNMLWQHTYYYCYVNILLHTFERSQLVNLWWFIYLRHFAKKDNSRLARGFFIMLLLPGRWETSTCGLHSGGWTGWRQKPPSWAKGRINRETWRKEFPRGGQESTGVVAQIIMMRWTLLIYKKVYLNNYC